MNNEPDQIDMMEDLELRAEFRKVCIENAELRRKLAEQQATLFTVRTILAGSVDDDAVKAIAHMQKHFADSHEELAKLISEAEQRGRDALMKELSEQEPVGYAPAEDLKSIKGMTVAKDSFAARLYAIKSFEDDCALIIRPSTPIAATKG